MFNSIDQFYQNKPEPVKGSLLALRDIILATDDELRETSKYGMPCFTLGVKPICYLWTDKKTGEPYILFVSGKQLNFDELETGNRAKMKILRINPEADLPLESIRKILNAAIALQRK